MKRADMYRAEREKGLTYQAIADKFGVTKQAVQCVCGKNCDAKFRRWDASKCVYPNVRKWLNENRITKAELIRRMGIETEASNYMRIGDYLRGKGYPLKQTIDRLLSATGLTYEQFFETEGGEG